MTQQKGSFEEAFKEAINSSFGFLKYEYGFSFFQDDAFSFIAKNKYCQITIFLDRRQIFVWIKPIVEDKDLKQYYPIPSVDLSLIAHCFNPNISFGYKALEIADIKSESDRIACLLKEYCSDFFIGDFSKWHRIEECRKKARQAWIRRQKG